MTLLRIKDGTVRDTGIRTAERENGRYAAWVGESAPESIDDLWATGETRTDAVWQLAGAMVRWDPPPRVEEVHEDG